MFLEEKELESLEKSVELLENVFKRYNLMFVRDKTTGETATLVIPESELKLFKKLLKRDPNNLQVGMRSMNERTLG